METTFVIFSVLILIAALADRSRSVNPPVMMVPVAPQANSGSNGGLTAVLLLLVLMTITLMLLQR